MEAQKPSSLSKEAVLRIGILSSHPIQYQAPWFREMAKHVELKVFLAFQPTAESQGQGFGRAFTWDVDLLQGYAHEFLPNVSIAPGAESFRGCDNPEIARRIEAEHFDAFIVCGWHLKCFWQAIIACRKRGIPILVRGDSQLLTPRSWWKKAAKEVLHRIILRQFSAFLSVGARNRDYLQHFGARHEKIFFVPHFVDNEWFAARAREACGDVGDERRRWGADDRTFVLLFVGKFQEKKRPADLLRVLDRIGRNQQSIRATNILAVFVGAGELAEVLQAEAARLALKVHFADFRNQSELPLCYAAADALVLPSDGGETWGLVVNEAMACGLPAIVSDAVGCAPDLIDDGRTGFVFPLGDISAFADQLAKLVALKASGHDFKADLAEKMKIYSIKTAVEGTIRAVTECSRRTIQHQQCGGF
jgi:glycosyltransferase involved in cell wall biosynthesis